MHEIIPVAAGAIIGVLVQGIRAVRLRIVVLVALCIAVGLLVSWFTGELAVSWGFLSVDALLVWLGAFAAVAGGAWWRARRATRRA